VRSCWRCGCLHAPLHLARNIRREYVRSSRDTAPR